MNDIKLRNKFATLFIIMIAVYLGANHINQVGKKITLKETSLTYVDSGYIGRGSTRNYYYKLKNGQHVRAPVSNEEHKYFLTTYLHENMTCTVIYFENNSLVNNQVSLVNKINCGDQLTYRYND
jgi:hypothetical protein